MTPTIRTRLALVAAGSAVVFGGAVADAQAAQTIGTGLATPDRPAFGTMYNRGLSFKGPAPGTVALNSPVDGVVTKYRIRAAGQFGGEFRLRIADEDNNNGFKVTFKGTGETRIASQAGINEFNARLPISKGDGVALTRVGGANTLVAQDVSSIGFTSQTFGGNPADGTAVKGLFGTDTLQIQADIEPDADKDGFGDETQDLCPQLATKQAACDAPDGTAGPPAGSDRVNPQVAPALAGRSLGTAVDATLRKRNLKRGVLATLTSSEAGRTYGQVEIDEKTARRAGFRVGKGQTLIIGKAKGTAVAGQPAALRLPLGERSQAKLFKDGRNAKLTVRLTVFDGAGNRWNRAVTVTVR